MDPIRTFQMLKPDLEPEPEPEIWVLAPQPCFRLL